MILVIFDIDGTLVYAKGRDTECFAESYQKVFGKTFPSIDLSTYPHVSDDTIFKTVFSEDFGRDATSEEVARFKSTFVECIRQERVDYPHLFNEVPGARNILLELLADDRFLVGLGTGGWRNPAEVKLDFVNIEIQDLYKGFADGNPTREHIIRDTINHALSENDNIQKVVYIGDAIWDIKTCKAMNIPLIGMRWRGDFEFFTKHDVQDVFKDYHEIDRFKETIIRLASDSEIGPLDLV